MNKKFELISGTVNPFSLTWEVRRANAVGEKRDSAHLAGSATSEVMRGIAMQPKAGLSIDTTTPAVLATLKNGVTIKANMMIDKPYK